MYIDTNEAARAHNELWDEFLETKDQKIYEMCKSIARAIMLHEKSVSGYYYTQSLEKIYGRLDEK